MTQFNVATSFGYKLFKTESIQDMPFEQYRASIALLNDINKQHNQAAHDSVAANRGVRGQTTYRIKNEVV